MKSFYSIRSLDPCKIVARPTVCYALGVLLSLGCITTLRASAQEVPPTQKPPSEHRKTPSAAPESGRKYLLGDWGGSRSRLEDKGVVFDFFYMTDLLSILEGGYAKANTGFERVRGTVDIDLGKLDVVRGLTFHATGLWQAGANVGSQYVGSVANPTSLSSIATTRLDSIWLQQALFHDKFFLKVGQLAGWDSFNLQEYGISFMNEPMGYTPVSFVNTHLPFNPAGQPALEIRVVPKRNYYGKASFSSGNRDPYKDDPTGVHFKIKDSPVLAVETGYFVQPQPDTSTLQSLGQQGKVTGIYPGVYKVGALYNPGRFTNPRTNGSGLGNYTIYFQGNQAVYRMGKIGSDARRGLDLTFQVNASPSDVNLTNYLLDAGARYLGPWSRRKQDSVAFGYVRSHNSSNFDTIGTDKVPGLRYGAENLFEVNYLAHLTRWMYVQPVFTYIQNPGARATHQLGDSIVTGFRLKLDL